MSVTPGAPRLTSLVMARTALELAVEAFADAVGGDAMGWAQDDAIADTLLSLVAVERRITALKGAVAARVSGGNAFAEAGFRNGASWVRSRTNESLAGARRIFEHGEWMLAVPLMGAAWRQGLVSLVHVRTLVESHDRFPRVSAALTHCEPELVEIAKELDPATFSRVLLAKLCEIDPEAMDDAESKRRRRDVGLHVSATIDGFVVVNGLLPPEIGQQLINSLAAAQDKARASAAEERDAAARAEAIAKCSDPTCAYNNPDVFLPCARCAAIASGDNTNMPREPERRLSAVNVDALSIILDAAASAFGDAKLPDVGGARPVVQVTIDSESLIAHGASAPGWITSLTGQQVTPVSARAVRRLACDSVRQLLLLDPRGHLDAISAQERVISQPMRKAITIRDGGRCRFPGCHHAIREIHHIVYWQHGGSTTTGNLVGLCSHHHHTIHDRGWTLSGDPNFRLTFTDRLTRESHSDPPVKRLQTSSV